MKQRCLPIDRHGNCSSEDRSPKSFSVRFRRALVSVIKRWTIKQRCLSVDRHGNP